jgi:hypothetical protein
MAVGSYPVHSSREAAGIQPPSNRDKKRNILVGIGITLVVLAVLAAIASIVLF